MYSNAAREESTYTAESNMHRKLGEVRACGFQGTPSTVALEFKGFQGPSQGPF